MRKEDLNGPRPKPEEIRTLDNSLTALTQRGAIRADVKQIIKVLEADNTWGLTKGEINTSLGVLRKFANRAYLFRDDVEELMLAFKEEERHAVVEWAKIREDTTRNIKKVGQAALSLVIATGIAAGVVMAWNPVNDYVYQNYSSPEAVAARQARAEKDAQIALQQQEAKKLQQEKEKQDRIKLEDQQTLGLNPSSISEDGFRIRYNPLDKNIKYTELGGDKSFFSLYANYWISWNQKNDKGGTDGISTSIKVDGYTRFMDGKKLPKLAVNIASSTYETWYLRDQTEGIDTSVVVFEDIKNKKEYYFSISWPEGSSYFQFRQMKKEVASSK